MRRSIRLAFLICPVLLGHASFATWTSVGDGIEYAEYTVSGPNRAFVARMDRANTNAIIESSIGQGRISGGTERTTSQANRYQDAINYWGQTWGQRNQVVVAVNGSYYNTSTGVPTGGMIHSGWYAKRYDNLGSESGFVWQLDRDAIIGGCVTHLAGRQFVTYTASGNTQTFDGINIPRPSDKLIIYTPQYDSTTLTDNSGVEVLVELNRPLLLVGTPGMVTGRVREIRNGQGATPIPFDHIVLSATGSKAATLLANVSVGAEIGVSQEIKSFEGNCSTPSSLDWSKSYAAVGGNWVFLRNNVIQYGIDSSGARHPRTAIAYNNTHVFFVVVDGRSTISIGMTIDELATFCKNTLGATWGVNQDGGGSSTMVVNGQIKNVPSDGTERPVSNGTLMVNVLPRLDSVQFAANDTVRAKTSGTAVRLGPGTNYALIASITSGTEATVLDHSLKGVFARGDYWWKCTLGNTTGWVAQGQLELVPRVFAADFDGDDDVDQSDFGRLQECLGAVGVATAEPACAGADLNRDDKVDEADFAVFQSCVSGAGVPATSACRG